MEVKIFTYSRSEAFGKIMQEGLIPQSRIIPGDPNSELAIFGLLDPQPSDWIDNQDFPEAWGRLRRHLTPLSLDIFGIQGGDLLLELSLDTDRTSVKVIDWASMERYEITRRRLEGLMTSAEAYGQIIEYNSCRLKLTLSRLEAQRIRRESMIPLADYLCLKPEQRSTMISLPEVVIPEPVLPAVVRVCSQQPLLLERLKSAGRSAVFSPDRDAIVGIQLVARRNPEIANCSALTQYLVY